MASTVKFKFKSAREYDTVSFPGTSIKLLDLKRAIVEQKRLHQGMEFDLTVVNDKTKEEYKEDTSIVTKNASVVVKRVPAPKTGGLLAKIKALDAAAALQSTATYDIPPFYELLPPCVILHDVRLLSVGDVVFRSFSKMLFVLNIYFFFCFVFLNYSRKRLWPYYCCFL